MCANVRLETRGQTSPNLPCLAHVVEEWATLFLLPTLWYDMPNTLVVTFPPPATLFFYVSAYNGVCLYTTGHGGRCVHTAHVVSLLAFLEQAMSHLLWPACAPHMLLVLTNHVPDPQAEDPAKVSVVCRSPPTSPKLCPESWPTKVTTSDLQKTL